MVPVGDVSFVASFSTLTVVTPWRKRVASGPWTVTRVRCGPEVVVMVLVLLGFQEVRLTCPATGGGDGAGVGFVERNRLREVFTAERICRLNPLDAEEDGEDLEASSIRKAQGGQTYVEGIVFSPDIHCN